MFVLTINQQDTPEAGDRVAELIEACAGFPAYRGFQRSWADEAIGIFDDPHAAVAAALMAVRQRRWNIGIGVGPVHEPIPEDICQAEGYGLIYARQAVEEAQTMNDTVALSVVGINTQRAEHAQAMLRLLGYLVYPRTEAEWRVLDLLTPGVRGQYKAVATALGISVQAVSAAVRRSLWVQEHQARPAAAELLAWVQAAGKDLLQH